MGSRETHHGIVIDNDDPEKKGRLRVECPTIASGQTLGGWIEPKMHFIDSINNAGAVWIPDIGSSVDVEIDSDPEAQVNGFDARWVCDVYPNGTFPTEFRDNYPKRRGWKTGSGHVLYFDDTSDEETFRYTHPSGTELVIDSDGNIHLKAGTGKSVYIGDGADEAIVRGDTLNQLLTDWYTFLSVHTHSGVTTGPGSTGTYATDPPAIVPFDLLSDDHKVK